MLNEVSDAVRNAGNISSVDIWMDFSQMHPQTKKDFLEVFLKSKLFTQSHEYQSGTSNRRLVLENQVKQSCGINLFITATRTDTTVRLFPWNNPGNREAEFKVFVRGRCTRRDRASFFLVYHPMREAWVSIESMEQL